MVISDTTKGEKLRANWSKDESPFFTEDIKVCKEHQLFCFDSSEKEKLEGAACCH